MDGAEMVYAQLGGADMSGAGTDLVHSEAFAVVVACVVVAFVQPMVVLGGVGCETLFLAEMFDFASVDHT